MASDGWRLRGHGRAVRRRSLLASALMTAASVGVGTVWRAPASAAVSVTFRVTSTTDAPDAHPGDGLCADAAGVCTLRAAVEEASAQRSGAVITVIVPAGHYRLVLGSLDLNANQTTITGADSATTVVDAGRTSRVMHVASGATGTLERLSITRGAAGPSGYGGGILNAGVLTLDSVVASSNTAAAGGGLANAGGSLTVQHSTVTANRAHGYGGGGIQNGGIHNVAGTVTIVDSTINANTAMGDGGGILNGQNGHPADPGRRAAPVRSWRAEQTGSQARRLALAAPSSLVLSITGTRVDDNRGDNAGGGIANDGGSATVFDSTVSGNATPNAVGGGISSYGSLIIRRSAISRNQSSYGGGIDAFTGGVGSGVSIETSVLSHNVAVAYGGAIEVEAEVAIDRSLVWDNSASGGGGLEIDGGVATLTNSTFDHNVAQSSGFGGAINASGCTSPPSTASYLTFASNSTALGLGCSLSRYSIVVTATIVTSRAGVNCIGYPPDETTGANLDSGRSCRFHQSNDLIATNPMLAALAANGGPTRTRALLPGSPAVDHGGTRATGCPRVDQRGQPRPDGPACDIGAYELEQP